MRTDFKHWGLQLFIAADQLLNVILTPGSAGTWADETLSCRAWRMHEAGKFWGRFWRPVIDWLFSWQEQAPGTQGHCHGAYLKERARTTLPPELR